MMCRGIIFILILAVAVALPYPEELAASVVVQDVPVDGDATAPIEGETVDGRGYYHRRPSAYRRPQYSSGYHGYTGGYNGGYNNYNGYRGYGGYNNYNYNYYGSGYNRYPQQSYYGLGWREGEKPSDVEGAADALAVPAADAPAVEAAPADASVVFQ